MVYLFWLDMRWLIHNIAVYRLVEGSHMGGCRTFTVRGAKGKLWQYNSGEPLATLEHVRGMMAGCPSDLGCISHIPINAPDMNRVRTTAKKSWACSTISSNTLRWQYPAGATLSRSPQG